MHLRLSLIVKLTLATSLILVGFMGILDYINLKNFRKATIEYAISNADQLTEIINQSTYDAMMKNDKASLYLMADRIAQSSSIEHISIIDRSGKVVFSSHKSEIGTIIDQKNAACIFCHQPNNTRLFSPTNNSSRLYRTANGAEVLGYTKAIYNQPECSTGACHFHDKDHHILGVLDITLSLESLRQQSHEYRMQFIVMTCMLLLFIGVLITFLTQRLVDRPVQRLVQHTARVSAGDMDARIPITSDDELGDLSEAVNDMTAGLAKANEELKEWAGNLEHKVEERSQEIKQMQAQLHRSEKLASLGNLVAGIAHEINNPLSGILLYASIVDNDKRLAPSLKPDLERIIAECRRCAEIVKQLLEFSREALPHKEAISLNNLLDRVVGLLQHQPSFQNISIKRSYTPDLGDVFVDSNQMQQVFVNLFINASHAMPKGGLISITTSQQDGGGFACVEIGDNGCGISEEDLQRIFDPFFTTKAEGTGLGLSISYGFVENNAGKIEVASKVGVGTTFTILLPLQGSGEEEQGGPM
ncbi:sensor histidine kinase [Oryzomonas rubra]|uniref:histidine kinase n=1 Tax=Oryzomonas rubra TaxID=2509454 RepID=A0A5A9XNK2_9BACT|nr:ATP-binding protein [Oryzomonas rubra]KAA0894125.1 HAMP domain-containing protein [Oryzomonas rubra]